MTQCIRHHPPANFDSCSMAWPNMSCDGCFSPKRDCVGLELTPRGYVHMISREKLERHSCKCYGQIHSYMAGVFTICGLSSHAPVNLFGLGQILRRQTNV